MTELEHLADTIRRAHAGPAWHGPALSEVLHGVTAEQASRRVGDAHTIWELAEHIIAWQDIVRRRIEGERLGDDNLTWEDNWPPVPEPTEQNWRRTVERAAEANRRLCERMLNFGAGNLDRQVHGEGSAVPKLDSSVPGKDYTFAVMLHGAAQHVIYHAGQIALLNKLIAAKPKGKSAQNS